MDPFLILGVLVIVIIYYINCFITKNFNYWKNIKVVGPKPVPLFGNIITSTLRRKNIAEVMQKIYHDFPEEKVVGVFRLTTPTLLIRDLEVIKHVMIKDFDCFSDRGVSFSKDGLGANLFHADTDIWRVLRNQFTPIFTSGKLKNMIHLLNDRGDKFVREINDICLQKSEHEIHSLIQRYTMATISACAFGLDFDAMADKMEMFKKIDKIIFSLSYAREIDMLFPGILKKINSTIFSVELRYFFEDLVKTVINERGGKPSNRKDFMDLVLELREKGEIKGARRSDEDKETTLELSDSIIAAQAFVFYAAGYETSATTMSFMLYELAKNPNIQDKLIKEIDDVLKRNNGEITYETLSDMMYMEKVFDETLRKYPLVDPIQRRAQVDYTIPNTKVVIKKGQKIFVSTMGIQHDPKYYPNPEVFDPERFSSEKVKDRHPCAYMPFGIGPRNCIGMRFAKVQSRICITKLLSRFRVEPSEKTPEVMLFDPKRVLIGPKNGIYLNLISRNV